MKVLFIQLRQIGDVLMTTPSIRALKSRHKDAEIHFLVNQHCAEAVMHNPFIDHLICVESICWLKRVWFFRQFHYDCVIDFMGTPKTARLAFYTGSGKRIGFGKRGRRIFYTHPVPVPGGRDYAAIEKAALLAPLGIGVSHAIPELYNSQTELREAKEILTKFNVVHHGKVIAFSPVSRRPYKQWPLSCFAQVCDALNEKYDLKFLPLFGPGEEKVIQSVIDLSKRKAAFLFPYSVSTFGRVKPLIEACLFYLGNDNGIRHAAVLCGVPTATVFGVHADPCRWTPAGDGRHQYIWGKEGIATVEPETVIRMVDRLIEKKLLYEKAQQTV